MSVSPGLLAVVDPVIDLVTQQGLRDSLHKSFAAEPEAVAAIEDFFTLLPRTQWSRDLLCTIVGSWKATHLKMLAIYGLSCRLNRLAASAEPAQRAALYLAAARNAETSYEDLGLDYDAFTHTELYDEFAGALIGDDSWQLRAYRMPAAHQFSRWVYRNMVVEDIEVGLFTNMFSEIYNHGEYSLAVGGFEVYMTRHSDLSEPERTKALTYIRAHVEDATEQHHFLVVVDALDRYREATGRTFDPAQAEGVFRSYLHGLAPVMRGLSQKMRHEEALAGGDRQRAAAALHA